MARPASLSGFPEWLPQERIVEQHVLDTLRRTFELWGLSSVETRAVEPLEQQFGTRAAWQEPADVTRLTDGQHLAIAGLDVDVVHAPGHTEGSVLFALPGAPAGLDGSRTVLSGDVLFAGSIGRTDLPGGNAEAMTRSLTGTILPLPDDTVVLPGHGPSTTIGRERRSNPFLLELAQRA